MFEIIFSCYSLDLPDRLRELSNAGFSKSQLGQISNSLRHLTNGIIHQNNGLWRNDRDKLAILIKRRERLLEADMDPISCIYWLLEDCKRYGTLPFAKLARMSFIGSILLESSKRFELIIFNVPADFVTICDSCLTEAVPPT